METTPLKYLKLVCMSSNFRGDPLMHEKSNLHLHLSSLTLPSAALLCLNSQEWLAVGHCHYITYNSVQGYTKMSKLLSV